MIQRIEDKEKAGIYVIENIKNNKVYVGKSLNIYNRIKNHITLLNKKSPKENRHLINAWHKYKRNNFIYYVVEYIDRINKEEKNKKLKESELYWMIKLNALNHKKGYNIRYDSEIKMICSESTSELLSVKDCERYKDENVRKQSSIISKLQREKYKESYKKASKKIAYHNRQYRIAKCNKKNNRIIKIYEIIEDILNENPNYYKQCIKSCCQNTKSSYKGFKWYYVDLNSDKIIFKNKENRKKIKIYKYEKCDDLLNTIKIYNSFDEILKDHCIFKKRSIQQACQGRQKRSGGFKWFYIDPDTNKRINKK